MFTNKSKTSKRICLFVLIISLQFGLGLISLAQPKDESPTQIGKTVNKVEDAIDLENVSQKATHLGVKVMATIFVVLGAIVLSRIGVFFLHVLAERAARFRFLKKIGPVYQSVIWVVAIYIIVDWVVNPTTEKLFAFFAASGVAIGFASQDILKNVFGGVMIILDRPFQIGDKIKVGEYYGEVTQIGLRTTRIVTPDDSMVSIPNSEVVSKAVSNANSGELDCQVVTEIIVPHGTNLTKAKTIAWEAAVTSQYAYLKKPVSVMLIDAPSEYAIRTKLKIKAYVVDTRLEFAFSTEVAEAVKEEFRKRGWLSSQRKSQNDPVKV